MFALMLFPSGGCFAAQVKEPGATLDQVMKLLAQRKHGQVSYVERDYLSILDQPVRSSGVLVYEAPDHLEKRTLTPKRESLILEGDELTVRRGRRTYRMEMSAYPQVAPFVDAIRDTLAGNEEALEKVFEVGFTGTLEDWRLRLVPLDKEVARKVQQVQIEGARDEIRTVEILQRDGDRSVMTLGTPADASAAGRPQGER
ncbi:MAG: outer membrane lipoprotein carrier protein LolA [Gammaproteobacteria bacterium]|nr:outer membrane lipoprotein carrier protein LolA [Gammaproteobacteria bacterium]